MALTVSAAALWQGTDPSHPVVGASVAEAPTTEPLIPTATGTSVHLVAVHGPTDSVTDGEGNVLYRYDHDQPSVSTCFGACAATWIPVLTSGTPAVTGIDPTLVSTLRRPDGTLQVTLAGWPLYRHARTS